MKTQISRRCTRVAILALIGLAWLSAAAAEQPNAPQSVLVSGRTVRLLTVGNSFSRNATRFLGDLVQAAGHELVHQPIIVGGASLELHAEKFRRHQLDAADKAGLYANGASLQEMLAADQWDYVTIQQASIKSHDVATYRPYAAQLAELIRTHAPQAKVLVHQTWAYRCDDPRFSKPAPTPGEPATQEAMYRGLTSAYQTIAAELGVRRIPVGDAFYRADTDTTWGYRPDTMFDFKSARPPALPDQTHSLHVGWRWMKGKDGKVTLHMDGHHAGEAGEYLAACVFYEVLFGDTVVGNPFVPPGIAPAYARFLQETADRAVTLEINPVERCSSIRPLPSATTPATWPAAPSSKRSCTAIWKNLPKPGALAGIA